ncbi:MAG: pentapeptide repeat-containing protein [Pyrinomonadaceae bacterium]
MAVANFGSAKVLSDADFSSATFSAAANFYSATFSAGANFRLAKFSTRINFRLATFSAGANFRLATFSAYAGFNSATFSADADFSSATFSGETHFDSAKFGKIVETRFYYANFAGDTFFDDAEFNEDVSFNSAIFGEDSDVFFRRTVFAGNADFQYCTSEGYLRFSDLQLRSRSRFDFQEAAFEKASRVSFHTISLRPHWFVNVDSRKFVFTDILWKNLDWDFWNKNIYAEIDSLPETGAAKQKKRIFEIAARQLAVNAEENNRYEEAAKFRYMAMETRRLEETKHFRASRLLMWLYKWSSGYGESWSRAALVLLFIWLGFGLVYWQFGSFQIETPLDVWQSLGYSSQVMLLQKPNPRPLSNLTFTLYVLETIFAPLQAALLALAIRRKFMR